MKKTSFLALLIILTLFLPTNILAKEKIAELTIFSDGSKGVFNSGSHAFISIKNISSSNMKIGLITVNPNMEITIGTWANRRPHKGIWYNLEAYFIARDDVYDKRVSLTITIDHDEIDKINNFLNNYNTWTTMNNCSKFSTKIWNLVSNDKLSAGFLATPKKLSDSIKSKDGFETKKAVQEKTKNDTSFHPSKKLFNLRSIYG